MGALDWLGVRRGAGNGNGDEDRIREGGEARGNSRLYSPLVPPYPIGYMQCMHT